VGLKHIFKLMFVHNPEARHQFETAVFSTH